MHTLPFLAGLSAAGFAAALHEQQIGKTESCTWSPLVPEYQLTCVAPFSKQHRPRLPSNVVASKSRRGVSGGYEPPEKQSSPNLWKGPERCSAGFCLFYNPDAGGGMSLITSPRMAHVVADSQDSLLSSGIEPEAFYEVEIPGKGSGLIANRTIRKGEIIMQRAPALLIQNHPHIDFEPGLRLEMYQAAVDRLPEPTRTNFLRQTGDTIYEKVQKNSFRVFVDGDTQHSAHLGIFPEVSKFNHDCRPNVHYRISNFTHTTVAVRDIPAGEELTVSYIYGMVPRAERLEQLREWGFTCSCPQCALSDRESSASDNRIRQIKMLEDEIESLMSAAASNRRRRRQRGSGAEGGGAEGNEDVALRPEMGSKLVELYLEERLDAYLTPAYTRAALLYSMFGHEERAQNYAREAVGALEREKGPRAGSLPSMRRLAENPRAHWSWGVMVTSGEAGGTRDKKNQTGGRGVRA